MKKTAKDTHRLGIRIGGACVETSLASSISSVNQAFAAMAAGEARAVIRFA